MTFPLSILLALLASVSGMEADRVTDGQWFHSFLRTIEAQTISMGNGITVAIVDSGVDSNHPDLSDTILPGTDLTTPGNGHIDVNGHGTEMAGLVAAHGRIRGIAPGAKILPVRSRTTDGDGASDKLAIGIRWAVSMGAEIISVSQTGGSDDLLIRQEVEAALAADVVVVAAAGNRPEHTLIGYPAAIPGVVAVTSLDRLGSASSKSASGTAAVIAAPGENISSTGLNGDYRVGTGTSEATAIVAGAVALVRSKFPQLKGPEVVRRLTATAIDKGPPGRDSQYGYGVLNIVGALTASLAQESSTPTAVLTSRSADAPGGGGGGFPWWLVAVPVVIAGGAVAFFFMRRKTRED